MSSSRARPAREPSLEALALLAQQRDRGGLDEDEPSDVPSGSLERIEEAAAPVQSREPSLDGNEGTRDSASYLAEPRTGQPDGCGGRLRRHSVAPAEAEQTIALAAERPHGIPGQRPPRSIHVRPRPFGSSLRRDVCSVEHAEQMLADGERAPEKIRTIAAPDDRVDAREQGR